MKCFVFVLALAVFIISCEPQGRECYCSMDAYVENEEIVDVDITNLSNKTDLSGELAADIIKYVDAEFGAAYTNDKNNGNARKIVKKIKSDYPDFYSKTYRFKIERIYYCTYYKNYCKNSSLTDSAYLNMANEKLDEFSKAFLLSFEQPEQKVVSEEEYTKSDEKNLKKIHLTLVVDYDFLHYNLVVNGKVEPFVISGSEITAKFETSSDEIIFFMKSKEGDKCRTGNAMLEGDQVIKRNYKCY